MNKRKSNIEFITTLMQIGNPLKQAFIIEAISKYAKEWKNIDIDKINMGFISSISWKECAIEIDKAIEKQYK